MNPPTRGSQRDRLWALWLAAGFALLVGIVYYVSVELPKNEVRNGADTGDFDPQRSGAGVSGTVTLNGNPVAGMVVFVASDGEERSLAPINAEGKYFIESPPIGQYKVVVRPMGTAPQGMQLPDLPDPPLPKGAAPPARYNDPRQTPLEYVYVSGEKTFDIELQP